ncbi:hypothetical protein FVE85_1694 [Porphyridium purpureum]|uniref:Phosphoglycolate phosphatase n=1 Tax=Porphyridium purpureum TaxID=35688 RepID=A0A5J4YVL0_PORPP|nr:hypothetical protein FVE85_1694 [Porphyridium purpureum]|eukprot:POR2699..scf209_3
MKVYEGQVWVLDFDGVICDSVEESTIAAFRTARRVWPEVLDVPRLLGDEPPAWMMRRMEELRCVVEHGYENVLLIRLLWEEQRVSETSTKGTHALRPKEIIYNWAFLKETLVIRWKCDTQALSDEFAFTRDEWIKRDRLSWLARNRLYPGVKPALLTAPSPVYICTTKHSRFVHELLQSFGITNIEEKNIFGLGSGPKAEVVANIARRHPQMYIHFIEDRLEALLETMELFLTVGMMHRLSLHFAVWGYNVYDSHIKAERYSPIIELLDLDAFISRVS